MEAKEKLGGKCQHCGSIEDLEFDHIDPSTKIENVSHPSMLDGKIEKFWVEVEKCQLLCEPCHRIKTKEEGSHCGGHNKIEERPHGSGMKYEDGCRCKRCRTWKRLYRNKDVGYREVV